MADVDMYIFSRKTFDDSSIECRCVTYYSILTLYIHIYSALLIANFINEMGYQCVRQFPRNSNTSEAWTLGNNTVTIVVVESNPILKIVCIFRVYKLIHNYIVFTIMHSIRRSSVVIPFWLYYIIYFY